MSFLDKSERFWEEPLFTEKIADAYVVVKLPQKKQALVAPINRIRTTKKQRIYRQGMYKGKVFYYNRALMQQAGAGLQRLKKAYGAWSQKGFELTDTEVVSLNTIQSHLSLDPKGYR